jgi:hypothetical protein
MIGDQRERSQRSFRNAEPLQKRAAERQLRKDLRTLKDVLEAR